MSSSVRASRSPLAVRISAPPTHSARTSADRLTSSRATAIASAEPLHCANTMIGSPLAARRSSQTAFDRRVTSASIAASLSTALRGSFTANTASSCACPAIARLISTKLTGPPAAFAMQTTTAFAVAGSPAIGTIERSSPGARSRCAASASMVG